MLVSTNMTGLWAVILAQARIQVARVPYLLDAGLHQHDGELGVFTVFRWGWFRKTAYADFHPHGDIAKKPNKMPKHPAVYILASQKNGTLYIGVTSDLVKRVWEHKNNLVEGFTNKYNVHLLVWYEIHETMETAITREKALKYWKRDWKLKLIEKDNPRWQDLYETIV
jgi:putative endonuclease